MGNISILNIKEINLNYKLSETFIIECIESRWIIPRDCENNLLDEEDITRLLLIRDLKDEFGVNDESIPIILHLLDQIYALQAQVKRLLEPDRMD